jgi:hypothetical protein
MALRQDALETLTMLSGEAKMKTSEHTIRMVEEQAYQELLSQRDRRVSEPLGDSDFLADRLMDNINASPLGHLLKVIATLPEVRCDKVERARRHVDETDDRLDAQMDVALDRVLEELILD